MTNRMQQLLALLLFCMSITLLQCTPSEVAGGSSGTEVSATVLSEGGDPIPDARVRIRPNTFLHDSSVSETYRSTHTLLDTITNQYGEFTFTDLLPDSYTIEIIVDDTLGSEVSCLVNTQQEKVHLPPVYASPLAEFNGSAQLYYGNIADISVQPYGLDREAQLDEFGNFSMKVPHGSHTFHIAAFQIDDPSRTDPFDQMDISVTMFPGEARDAGTLQFRSPPSIPCEDGSCDSMVVEMLLMFTGNGDIATGDVTETDENGRIVSFDAHGLNFTMGIPFDIIRLSALKKLNLSNTHLPLMFSGIGTLTQLEEVRLADNHLTHFYSSSIGTLSNLRILDLSNNKLTIIPDSLANCSALESLSVSGNRLCFVNAETEALLAQFDSDWRITQNCGTDTTKMSPVLF